jgi:L-alanine-DL-glutamate epimerase-like enolase superfamily enzyme
VPNTTGKVNRRDFLRALGAGAVGTAGLVGFSDPLRFALAAPPSEKGISITGIAVATINGLNQKGRIVRLDTNKGISGYGECRVEDTNAGTELTKIKPTILGMNPTQIDKVFNAITTVLNPTADWTKQTYASGAIAAIECACWDITGKVYNVPIWKLLGPKLRDGMRMYCDTPRQGNTSTLQTMVQERLDMGFTWFKTDLDGILSSSDHEASPDGNPYAASGGTARRILDSGLTKWHDYVAAYRKMIGNAPLSGDHFFPWAPGGGGNLPDVASAIKAADLMGQADCFDQSLGGWCEDIIPWHYTSELAQICAGTTTNILTGEDMFGVSQLQDAVKAKALDVFHPDPATFGGIHPSRLAAEFAAKQGVKTAFHNSNSVFSTIMCAHICAGIPNFLSCEHHYPELTWFDSLVDGIPKPVMQKGTVPIPEGPGLGITPNQAAMTAHGTWFAAI